MALCRTCSKVIPCHCHLSPPVEIRYGVYLATEVGGTMKHMYVLASQWTKTKTHTVAASTDLEALQKSAEDKLRKDTGSTRFKWERDEDDENVPMDTDRLLLLRWSNVTKSWIGSGRYIDTVPLLGTKKREGK